MVFDNIYIKRADELVETHSKIGSNYVPKDSKSLQRWLSFTDKVLKHIDLLNTKAVVLEQQKLD